MTWKNKADSIMMIRGDYTKAMDCIEKVLEINPNDLEALVLKGKILPYVNMLLYNEYIVNKCLF